MERLKRRLGKPALLLDRQGIRHAVRFVEDDQPVEVCAQPFHDLLDARLLARRRRPPDCRVCGEHHAITGLDLLVRLRHLSKVCDGDRAHTDRVELRARILLEALVLREENGLAAPARPVVHDDPGDLPRLSDAGPVADEISSPDLAPGLVLIR